MGEETVAHDPYVQLLSKHLDDPTLFTSTPAESRARQEELLLPYLDFFLRHDREGFHRRLFTRKGLLDGAGELRPDLRLEDLAALRVHSDDLRGDGQQRRLVAGVYPGSPGARTFVSSGTTENTVGPVRITRSATTVALATRALGGQMEWLVGHGLTGSVAMVQAAEEMKQFMALPALAAAAFSHAGADVVMGARLRDDPAEPSLWRRLEQDHDAMRRFFEAPVRGKVWLCTPAGLAGLLGAAARPIDLGPDGVLMTGGGLKRLPQFATFAELLAAVAPVISAPTTDVLGLTESTTVFGARATQPDDARFWVKCPHPLTYVGYFESPQRLLLTDDVGEPRLLFYVNFTCIDYVEAVISGDVVRPQHTPDYPQHGFVYERRAEDSEGFAIREGCG